MVKENFNDLEILKIAISLEEEGTEFYNKVANNAEGRIKDFLLNAAVQEMLHKENFLKLYNELSANWNLEDEYLFDPEVSAYLRLLIENQVFDNKEVSDSIYKDLKEAAAYAVKSEKLTVELYTKMYEGIKYPGAKEALKVLIEEEKAHVNYFEKLLSAI